MRNLNPDQLAAFSAVIEQGGFTKAAEALGLGQPAVSHQIRELERRLRLRLVERVGRTVSPTAAGRELLAHASRIRVALADAEAALAAFDGTIGGPVRLGAGATACIHLLPPLLGRLKRQYPALQIAVSTGNTPEIVRRVAENRLDAALVTLPAAGRSLVVSPVLDEPFVVIGPAQSDRRRTIGPRQLADRPLVLFETGANTRLLVERWFALEDIAPRPAMELGSVEAIKPMVAAGLGWSLLPRSSVASAGQRRGLVVLEPSPPLVRTLAWVIRRDKPVSRALAGVAAAVRTLRA